MPVSYRKRKRSVSRPVYRKRKRYVARRSYSMAKYRRGKRPTTKLPYYFVPPRHSVAVSRRAKWAYPAGKGVSPVPKGFYQPLNRFGFPVGSNPYDRPLNSSEISGYQPGIGYFTKAEENRVYGRMTDVDDFVNHPERQGALGALGAAASKHMMRRVIPALAAGIGRTVYNDVVDAVRRYWNAVPNGNRQDVVDPIDIEIMNALVGQNDPDAVAAAEQEVVHDEL